MIGKIACFLTKYHAHTTLAIKDKNVYLLKGIQNCTKPFPLKNVQICMEIILRGNIHHSAEQTIKQKYIFAQAVLSKTEVIQKVIGFHTIPYEASCTKFKGK